MSSRMSRPRGAAGPTTAVLGVVALVLVLALIVIGVVVRKDAPSAGLSTEGQHAVDTARVEARNLITYSRATFDSDFQRSLDGTTGTLKQQLTTSKASTLSAMTKGKFDLSGQVTNAGLVSITGGTAIVLVSSDGYQQVGSKSTLVAHNRLQLTMTKTGSAWLVSDLESVGLV